MTFVQLQALPTSRVSSGSWRDSEVPANWIEASWVPGGPTLLVEQSWQESNSRLPTRLCPWPWSSSSRPPRWVAPRPSPPLRTSISYCASALSAPLGFRPRWSLPGAATASTAASWSRLPGQWRSRVGVRPAVRRGRDPAGPSGGPWRKRPAAPRTPTRAGVRRRRHGPSAGRAGTRVPGLLSGLRGGPGRLGRKARGGGPESVCAQRRQALPLLRSGVYSFYEETTAAYSVVFASYFANNYPF